MKKVKVASPGLYHYETTIELRKKDNLMPLSEGMIITESNYISQSGKWPFAQKDI